MDDFDDIDGFQDHAAQGRRVQAYLNGEFENGKGRF